MEAKTASPTTSGQRLFKQSVYLGDTQKKRLETLCKELNASVSELFSCGLFLVQSQKEGIKKAIKKSNVMATRK